MFSHIVLGTNDLDAAIAFYDQVMATVGYARLDTGDTYAGYGKAADIGSGQNCLWINMTLDGEPATSGNGTNIALLAEDRQSVNAFHAAAIEHGGARRGCARIKRRGSPTFLRRLLSRPGWPQTRGRLS